MTAFDRWIAFLRSPGIEGEYSNDPEDPGGETKFGISKRSYPHLDIKNLTEDQARDICLRDFWNVLHCEELAPAIAIVLADGGFNQGQPAAAQCLQYAVGFRANQVDGIIGHLTLEAVAKANPKELLAELVARRAVRYSQNPKRDRNGLGWFRRLARCHQSAMESV
jgi:lysozyme family protein